MVRKVENVGLVWFAVTSLEAMLCLSSLSVLLFSSFHARRREVFKRELRSAISQENGEGFGAQGGGSGVHQQVQN